MPLIDVIAENVALDACYGDNHSTTWPDSVTIRLFDGDPRDGGVELDAVGGYEGLTVTNDDTTFPPADAGAKTTPLLDFGTSTDAWSASATWAVIEADSILIEAFQFDTPVTVAEAGVSVQVQLVLFHEDVV